MARFNVLATAAAVATVVAVLCGSAATVAAVFPADCAGFNGMATVPSSYKVGG